MPKNKGKGNRKRGKNEEAEENRRLFIKGAREEYAQVVVMIGNDCEVLFIDNTTRFTIHIPAKMQKKVSIGVGDIVLVSLVNYKPNVIHKYMPDEARYLKRIHELPEEISLNEGNEGYYDHIELNIIEMYEVSKSMEGNLICEI